MKIIHWSVAIALGLLPTACSSGGHDEHEHEHEHDATTEMAEHEHEDEHGDEHEHGHKHGSDEIKMTPEAAKRLGVEVARIDAGAFSDVLAVSGVIEQSSIDRTVVSAPTAGIFRLTPGLNVGKNVGSGMTIGTVSARGISGGDQNEAGRVALQNARRELERVTPLYKEGLATRAEYDAAVAAVNAASAGYSAPAASGQAVSSGQGVIVSLPVSSGQYVEVGQPVAVIARNTRVTLRADVPQKYYARLATVTTARFRPDYSTDVIDISRLNGRLMSEPASASAAGGYIPVYFSLDNDGRIMPGAFVDVYLLGSPRQGVLSVPREAIVEAGGNYFVYTRVHKDAYSKHQVELGATDGNRVEITGGLTPGREVVVKGASMVRLAETQNVAPPGHSHNH